MCVIAAYQWPCVATCAGGWLRRSNASAAFLFADRNSLQFVELWGPTNFAEVIHHAAVKAAEAQRVGNGYIVLLILTDGAITDMVWPIWHNNDPCSPWLHSTGNLAYIVLIRAGWTAGRHNAGDRERVASPAINCNRGRWCGGLQSHGSVGW